MLKREKERICLKKYKKLKKERKKVKKIKRNKFKISFAEQQNILRLRKRGTGQ